LEGRKDENAGKNFYHPNFFLFSKTPTSFCQEPFIALKQFCPQRKRNSFCVRLFYLIEKVPSDLQKHFGFLSMVIISET